MYSNLQYNNIGNNHFGIMSNIMTVVLFDQYKMYRGKCIHINDFRLGKTLYPRKSSENILYILYNNIHIFCSIDNI